MAATDTVSTTVEPASQATSAEDAKTPDRGGLVLPVILIIGISLLTTYGLVWVTARLINQNAEAHTWRLATSMLSVHAKGLKTLAIDYASASSAFRDLMGTDAATAGGDDVGSHLAKAHGLFASMVISAEDRTLWASLHGQSSTVDAFGLLPEGLRTLVDQARAEPGDEPVAVAGLARLGSRVLLLAVSPIESVAPAPVDRSARPVLVLARALDRQLLGRAGLTFALDGLEIVQESPPKGYLAKPLTDVDGNRLGLLAWRDPSPGDWLHLWLTPSLVCALSAMTYLLYLFFRSTDLILAHQAHLVTRLKRERELRKLKSRFVAMMSHELRTPLATIRSAVDLLDRYEGRMTAEDRGREIGAIRTAVSGLTSMIEDALDLGRSDSSAQNRRATLNLGEFCREIWDESARALGSSHRLVLAGPAVDRTVEADETALRAVLSNLFQNAIKYSPGREEVAVEVSAKEDDCTFRVTDSGHGIPAEEQPKIFEAFHRGQNADTVSGTGLGLAVAKAAAERLGGMLSVESRPGAGATFTLALPEFFKQRPNHRRKESS